MKMLPQRCKFPPVSSRRSNRDVSSWYGYTGIRLKPSRPMSLDEAIEYLADDELFKVTPASYCICKRILETKELGKQTKKVNGSQFQIDCHWLCVMNKRRAEPCLPSKLTV
jgi:hypothetical protein